MTLSLLAVKNLEAVRDQFTLSTGDLPESIAAFQPREDMMTVAQHVAHAAQVIDWLVEGAFGPQGFDLDFERQIARVMAVTSLTGARQWFDESIARATLVFRGMDDGELLKLLPDGPVMGGMPRLSIVVAIAEHTSHHRGSIAVYARLNKIVPASPYGM